MHLVFEEVCKYVKVIPLHQFRPVRCDRTLQMSDINVRLFEFGTVNMLIRQIFNLAIFHAWTSEYISIFPEFIAA